jgi:hypothetical protein
VSKSQVGVGINRKAKIKEKAIMSKEYQGRCDNSKNLNTFKVAFTKQLNTSRMNSTSTSLSSRKRTSSLPAINRSLHSIKQIKQLFTTARKQKLRNSSLKIQVKIMKPIGGKKKKKKRNWETRSRYFFKVKLKRF